MKDNKPSIRNPKSAFTLVELLVVIAVIVILLMLLLPAVGTMRARSRQAQCLSNQKQVYDAWYRASPTNAATSAAWPDKVQQFMEGAVKVMICPDDPAPVTSAGGIKASYGLNAHAWHMDSQDNGRIVLLDYKQLEARIVGQGYNALSAPTGWDGMKAPRHFFTENVTFYDGRTTSIDPQNIDPRVCEYFVKYWRPERDNLILPPAGCVAAGSPLPGGTTTGGSTGASTGTTTSGGTTTAGTSGASTTTTGSPPAPCPALTGIAAQVNVTATVSGVNEGAQGQTTPTTFTVTLSQALTQTVTVQVVTVDETATVAHADYTALNQTVTFTAGQTSQTVTVNVLGNNVSEPDKTFRVEPRNPTFAGTACQQLTAGSYARLTIYNDDTYTQPADPCKPPGAPQQVADGLDWLVRHQFDDGSWSLSASTHPDCRGQCTNDPPFWVSSAQGRTAATGLALLPLIGSGSSPTQGPYRAQVCKGINLLMAMQWPNGSLESSSGGRASYAHLICHLALAMAYEKSKDAIDNHCADSSSSSGCTVDIVALKNSVELATSFTCSNEYTNPGDGLARYGWRYSFFGDLSHHVWGTAALAIASRSGTNVPATALAHAKSFLDSSSISVPPLITDSGRTIAGQYRYQTGAEGSPNQWTEMGLLCQLYLGVPKSHAAVQQYVNSQMAPDVVDNNYYSYWPLYGNMHGTQLRYFVGGAQWQTWNQAIQAQVLATQSQAGHSKGSFEIPSGRGEQASGGRLAVTVLSLLCLEPNYTGLR